MNSRSCRLAHLAVQLAATTAVALASLLAHPRLALAGEPASKPASAAAEPAPKAEGPSPEQTPSPVPGEAAIDEAGSVTTTSAPTQAEGRVRSKWHIGFGVGAQMLSRSNMPATSFNLQVGGRLNDHFSLGVDLNAVGNEEAALANALIEGVYFPSKKLGLNVQGGAGVAAAGRIASTTTIYGGFGYGAAVGWDFQVKRRFNIGISARLDGLVHTDDRHIWTAGGMLSFTWW